MARRIFLYWHTLKYLKAKQILFRLWRRIYKPNPILGAAPSQRCTTGHWVEPITTPQSFSAPDCFTLLGDSGHLNDLGWNGPERNILWRYNQHYFSDLVAQNADTRADLHQDLIARWVNDNPPGIGIGWEPYPSSLRIVNWIKWAQNGNTLSAASIESLANQVRWLTKNMEWHILGNHLFANAKALIFAGLWFDGPEAKAWLNMGLRILKKEVPEQILSDGGHFELSTMYHALALEDFLDLANITTCFSNALKETDDEMISTWLEQIPSMQRWLTTMNHPDGEISFFNDAAIGIAPSPAKLEAYAARLNYTSVSTLEPVIWLPDTGYARLSTPDAVLFADMAAVGPDYLPGHAHADTLSFELSVYGKRVISNSGTSLYGLSEERHRQRSTAAHSTVVIDGENSSEVWSGFRVARRARVKGVSVKSDGDSLIARATHDGYSRLKGRPLHHRSWTLNNNELLIRDTISGKGNHDASIVFIIPPDWQPELQTDGGVLLKTSIKDQAPIAIKSHHTIIQIERTTWHPSFGTAEPCWKLLITLSGELPLSHDTEIRWENQ